MQLSNQQKSEIIAYYKLNMRQEEIARKANCNQSTVSRIIKKYIIFETTNHLKGNGRPKILGTKESEIILKKREISPKTSLRKMKVKLQNEDKIQVSYSSIKRLYNSHNIYSFSPIKKPKLTSIQVNKRFEFSKTIIKMPEQSVKKIIFSDESKFNLFYSDGKVRVWREPGYGLKNNYIQTTVKHGGGSVMVWGCFSYNGVGKLVFIEGTMTAASYVNILSSNLSESARLMNLNDFIFQQDNDPKHTARITKEYFAENNINLLKWPAQSPDLNPIEQFWERLKVKISERQPKNIPVLKDMIQEEWSNISVDVCRKYALSFKNRGLALYKSKGGYIKY